MPSLVHALSHHAKSLEPIVGVLAVGILTELQPRGWKVYHYRSGPNSWAIKKGNHEFHFRRLSSNSLYVKDSYYGGKYLFDIKTRADAAKFIRMAARMP